MFSESDRRVAIGMRCELRCTEGVLHRTDDKPQNCDDECSHEDGKVIKHAVSRDKEKLTSAKVVNDEWEAWWVRKCGRHECREW